VEIEKRKKYVKKKRRFMVADKKNVLWYIETHNEKALM